MVSTLRFALVTLLLAGVARADLQLTPTVEEYAFDGAKLKRLVFFDDAKRVTYTPPHGWRYSESNDRFVLHPPSDSTAEAVISVTKLGEPQVFDDATMQRLSEEVVASVPNAATNITVVSQQKNPLLIEHKETFLLVINYDFYGNPYARSVMFLNRPHEQLRFELTCPRWDFLQLQKEFFSSQFSWQNL